MSKNIIILALAVLAIGLLWSRSGAPLAPQDEASLETQATTTPVAENTQTPQVKTVTSPTPVAAKKPETPTVTTTVTAPAPTQKLPSMTKDGIYLIYYTDKGFSPASLDLVRGASVRFVNNSNKAMRIMTTDLVDRQPTNEINQSKTVGKGGTYGFTFSTPATYGYRNENNPADQGVIVVR